MGLHILESRAGGRRFEWQRFAYRGHVEIHLSDGSRHYARCLEITFCRITLLINPAMAIEDPVVVAIPVPLLMHFGGPLLALPARTVYRLGVRRQFEFFGLSRAKRVRPGDIGDTSYRLHG